MMGRGELLLFLIAMVAIGAVCACGAAEDRPVADAHDQPVPASEAREVVGVKLALSPASDCDEKFDLLLYRDRGVVLVEWDRAPTESCAAWHATIHYLPNRVTRDALIAELKKIANTVEVER